jgi:hypothetical protein
LESIPGLLKSLKIRALVSERRLSPHQPVLRANFSWGRNKNYTKLVTVGNYRLKTVNSELEMQNTNAPIGEPKIREAH